MASRQHRTELTIKEKLEIINSLKNNKCSQKDLQERYKISKHMISRILSREDDLRSNKNSKMRRIRCGSNRLVDEAVSKWYRSMQEQNIYVNGPLLRQQAVRFARMMNNHTFQANNGWLWRWQQKENVKFNCSYAAKKAISKANNSEKINRDINELSENTSLQSFGDSNTIVSWQTMPNQLEQSDVPHFEINVKEEVDDLHRNPFEADVVFDIESDEQGGYDNEENRNNYPTECVNVDAEETKNDQDDFSMDRESFQDNDFYHQPDEIKDEPNDFRINDSEEESERYRSEKKRNINMNDPRDIYSIYGDYIARRLRASANERENYEIYIAQHNIDDVIFKLSMGSYARSLPSNENSMSGNNGEQTRQTIQSRQKQLQESIIKEKQPFLSTTASKGKKNDLQDGRSAYYVTDKRSPGIVNDFLIEKI